jgi:hypothetical protein
MRVKEGALDIPSTPRLVESSFTIELSLSVADGQALWAAAAEFGLAAPGATFEDVCDSIGPRDDPDLPACLAMLTAPRAIGGCQLHDFEIVEHKGGAFKAAANDLAAARAGIDVSA